MMPPRIPRFFIAWFIFVGLASASAVGFVLYLLWRLVEHYT